MADPGTTDTAQLIRLSGLTDRRLRELAREGAHSLVAIARGAVQATTSTV